MPEPESRETRRQANQDTTATAVEGNVPETGRRLFPAVGEPSIRENAAEPEFASATTQLGFFASLVLNPARDWVLLFLVIQCLADLDGNTNAYSRWAAMAAMAEDHSLNIDNYHQHTIDWARTPDGHYYSNKAPGPAILGYPLFRLIDEISVRGTKTREERDQKRLEDRSTVLHILSVATQAVPYGLFVMLLVAALQPLRLPLSALHVTAVALLFGNTASLYMNTYFGHGMAAMFVLAMLWALHRGMPFRIGLFFGLAALCDYGAALLGLPLLWAVWHLRRSRVRILRRFLLGGLVPGAVFVAYHYHCFGGPFSLPNKFQNPAFLDVPKHVPNLWGVLRLLPKYDVVLDLLWGPARGLLYTQPWVLLCLLLSPFLLWRRSGWTHEQRAFAKRTSGFAIVGLALLLWMNASFGAWHGGATQGPRYLAVAFPALALALAGLFARAPGFWRQALVVTLAVSTVPFLLLFSTSDVRPMPQDPLLAFYLSRLLADQGRHLERGLFIAFGFAWVGWRAWRDIRRAENPVP